MRIPIVASAALVALGCASNGSRTTTAVSGSGSPNFAAITETDLRRDMVAMGYTSCLTLARDGPRWTSRAASRQRRLRSLVERRQRQATGAGVLRKMS